MAKSTTNTLKKCRISETMFENGYIVGPKVGAGSYAKVRLIERISDAKILAAKIIEKEKAPKKYVKIFMPRELRILENIRHAHIVCVQRVIQTDKLVFIIMDYAQKGDLLNFIKTRGPPAESRAKLMFQQIVSAIHYLHGNGIVHRDLKCENILIKNNGDLQISDFGFARHAGEFKPSRTFCGSVAYASPQVLEGTPYDPRKNDVWGLGCILFILVCGSMPFDDTNVKKMMRRQWEGVHFPAILKDRLNPEVKALVRRLLDPEQEQRGTTKDILQSTWLKKTDYQNGRATDVASSLL